MSRSQIGSLHGLLQYLDSVVIGSELLHSLLVKFEQMVISVHLELLVFHVTDKLTVSLDLADLLGYCGFDFPKPFRDRVVFILLYAESVLGIFHLL